MPVVLCGMTGNMSSPLWWYRQDWMDQCVLGSVTVAWLSFCCAQIIAFFCPEQGHRSRLAERLGQGTLAHSGPAWVPTFKITF